LYNGFSFPDTFHPQGAKYRWGLTEGVRLTALNFSNESLKHLASGTVIKLFPIIEYRHLLKRYMLDVIEGELAEYAPLYDYQSVDNLNLSSQSKFVPMSWFQNAYQTSAQQRTNMSFQAFELFLQQAQKEGKKVIIAPIPEPTHIFSEKWANGISKHALDEQVAKIANQRSEEHTSELQS